MTRRPISIAVALALALTAALSGARADQLHDKIIQHQQQINATNTRIRTKKDQLESQRHRAAELHDQLLQTYGNIDSTNAEIGDLETKIRWNQQKLDWSRRQLQAAQDSLHRHDDALRHRLVDAYEHGNIGYVNVLLASTSFSDFVERWEDIRLLIASNQRSVAERRRAEEQVAHAEAALEQQQLALDDANAQEQQARQRLNALAEEKRNLIAAVDAQKRQVAAEVAQLEEVSAQEEAELTALIQQRQREEEQRREAQRRAAMLSGQQLPPGFGQAPRKMQWPVSGPISSPFGMRPDPFTGAIHLHPGIDIAVPIGTTVTAAAGGRVIVIERGYSGGYGNHIVIDHGGGIATNYAHLSEIFVTEGQEVQQGQAIGASGSTGYSTGPHLHFEVRVNGNPVDPLGWLH